MLWKEVKSWAKEKGYKTDRSKIQGADNSYHYIWSKIDDPSINGEASSVSKVATAMYNNMTNNKHLEYQQQYLAEQAKKDIIHEEPSRW